MEPFQSYRPPRQIEKADPEWAGLSQPTRNYFAFFAGAIASFTALPT
jgi:hypothetical protein